MPDILITDSEYGDASVETPLAVAAGLTVERAECRTADQVVAAAGDARALVVQYAPITDDVLERLPLVRVVSRYGTGFDNVDVEAATARGVWVANVPQYGTDEVAIHTLALLLACVRGFPRYDAARRSGQWPAPAVVGVHPRHLALGVVGAGRIGRRVIELAAPVFGEVVWFDPVVDSGVAIADARRASSLEELLAASNALTLHLPLTPGTRHLIGREELARLRTPRFVVNAARGALISEDALLAALEAGEVEAAGLDVHEFEPADPHGALASSPRVLLTPHAAWASEDALVDVRRRAMETAIAALRDGRPATPVNEVVAA